MIQLESAHIEELRGIRKLDLQFDRKTFAISGPNGSGKSGVIDAIEFGLTGQIGRLAGPGTRGLTISEHGPHVDKAATPGDAFVQLGVFFPRIGKTATITRRVASPNSPDIQPADPEIMAAFDEVSRHPEIALSRRDIVRFILVEPSKRSDEIQALLRLDALGQVRGNLKTAWNKLQNAHSAAAAVLSSASTVLAAHLQTSDLSDASILDSVNVRRNVLQLAPINELGPGASPALGISATPAATTANKHSAMADVRMLDDTLATARNASAPVLSDITQTLDHVVVTELTEALRRRSLIDDGIGLVAGAECPLCDLVWEDQQTLLHHLQSKLAHSDEAAALQEKLLHSAALLADKAVGIVRLAVVVRNLSGSQSQIELANSLDTWTAELQSFEAASSSVVQLVKWKDRLRDDWPFVPAGLDAQLTELRGVIEAWPDQDAILEAQTYLTTAHARLQDYRVAKDKEVRAASARTRAKEAYDAYCSVLETELNTLYQEVEHDFSELYRELNDDEKGFRAALTPNEGTLDLRVNFYERGLFPPAAYHSEGHQDGMGVCLYLALMKRLFGDNFTLALLDDVVMSVDASHRYQFCRLLKTRFPGTQFIITTHDRVWAAQMRSAGLITGKSALTIYRWSVDTGPLVESTKLVWDEIRADVYKGRIGSAAAALRHHLEYACRALADQLGAQPPFRADGDYELGELLPSVLSRMKGLLGKAAAVAQQWGNQSQHKSAVARKEELSALNGAMNVEQWTVNKAVHYNEWANFVKEDFAPVVDAFEELLRAFRCDVCQAWLHIVPGRGPTESLKCDCGTISFNLKEKST